MKLTPISFRLHADIQVLSGEQRDSLKATQDVLSTVLTAEQTFPQQPYQPHVARMEEGVAGPGEGFEGPGQPFDIYNQGINNIPSQMETSRPFASPMMPQQAGPQGRLVVNAPQGVLADSTGRVQIPTNAHVPGQTNPDAATQQIIHVVETQPSPSVTAVTQAQLQPTFAAMQLGK